MHTARYKRRQRSAIQTDQWARRGAAREPMERLRWRRLVQSRRRSVAFGDSNAAQRRRAIKAAYEATGLVYTHGDPVDPVSSRRHCIYVRANEFASEILELTDPSSSERREQQFLPSRESDKESEREAGKCFLLFPFPRREQRDAADLRVTIYGSDAMRRLGLWRFLGSRFDREAGLLSKTRLVPRSCRRAAFVPFALFCAASQIMQIRRSDGYQWLLSDDDRKSWRNV